MEGDPIQNFKSCRMKECGPREKVTDSAECEPCADYQRQDGTDSSKCKTMTCSNREFVEKDATCSLCPDY